MYHPHILRLVAALLLLGTAGAHAFDFCAGELCYDLLPDGTVAVARDTDTDDYRAPSRYSGVVIVPQTVGYDGLSRTVSAIADSAFYRSAVTEVQLPNSITTIGRAAFAGSDALTGITLPLDLRRLAPQALAGTALRAVALPDGLRDIGDEAFSGCERLHTVLLPAELRHIGRRAFSDCHALFEVYCAAAEPPATADDAFDGLNGVDLILNDDDTADCYSRHDIYGDSDSFSLWPADEFSTGLDNAAHTWQQNWLRLPLGGDIAYKIYGEDGYLMAITAADHYYFALGDHAAPHLVVPSTLIYDSDTPLAIRVQAEPEPAIVDYALADRPVQPLVTVSGSALHIDGLNDGCWIDVYDIYGRCHYHQPAMLNVVDGLARNQIYIVVVGDRVQKVIL